jgi:hypothetical protein
MAEPVVSDYEYQQRVRRYKPSSLMPLIAAAAARYWQQQDWLNSPFHPASRGQYSFVGQGLLLRYVIQLARELTCTADRIRTNGVQPVGLPSQSDSSPGRRGRNVPNDLSSGDAASALRAALSVKTASQ